MWSQADKPTRDCFEYHFKYNVRTCNDVQILHGQTVVWGPDLFSGGRKEGKKGLETLAAFPCALECRGL